MVDWKWMKQWKKYVGYDHRSRSISAADNLARYAQQQHGWFEKGQPSAHPGPVDNASLFLHVSSKFIRIYIYLAHSAEHDAASS